MSGQDEWWASRSWAATPKQRPWALTTGPALHAGVGPVFQGFPCGESPHGLRGVGAPSLKGEAP